MGKYDDIISLPHPVSKTHPPMPRAERAAQFSSFAALTGYEEIVAERARLTETRAELDRDALEALDEKLRAVDFFFNLSHSGSRVMCVAADVPVGCDVQQCYDISEYRKIARRFFSQDETAAMDNVPEEEAKQLFFRYWVLKESYIKASGKGFSTPLNSFSIHFSENGVPVLCGDSDEKTAFLELKLNDGYFYACCLLGKTFIEQFRTEWIDFFKL